MRRELRVDLRETSLARVEADCAVVAFFEDERPMRGGAGLVDWRLCGRLSRLVLEERLSDRWGLLPSQGRLQTPRILVGNLGRIRELDAPKLQRFARDAGRRVTQLRARSVAWDLPAAIRSLPAETGIASVLSGFRAALALEPGELELLFCVSGEENLRWRVALERAAARQPRSDTPLLVAEAERRRATARSPTASLR